jgi:3-oxoacyl-[acyl-carrier protein] reductase
MDLMLKGKRALVCGGSLGLGLATAIGLAKEGVQIALNSRSEENLSNANAALVAASGAEPVTIPGDLTVPGVPAQVVDQAADSLGGIDLLFTNTGGPPAGAFEAIPDEDWVHAVNLSFLSHVALIRAALPHLRKSDSPSVLTVTSISIKQPIPNLVLSNSIRAATAGLTKTLALELGPEGIRFNSILPSWTMTERIVYLLKNRAEQAGTTLQIEMDKQANAASLGRLGNPEEFANAAVFLLSPAASYITGAMLSVDGGTYQGLF